MRLDSVEKTVRFDSVRPSSARLRWVQFGSVRFCLVRSSRIRFSSVRFHSVGPVLENRVEACTCGERHILPPRPLIFPLYGVALRTTDDAPRLLHDLFFTLCYDTVRTYMSSFLVLYFRLLPPLSTLQQHSRATAIAGTAVDAAVVVVATATAAAAASIYAARGVRSISFFRSGSSRVVSSAGYIYGLVRVLFGGSGYVR